MGRYILRFTGQGSPPAHDLERIRSVPGLTVVDESSPRMLLVQGPADAIQQLGDLPSWVVTAERFVPVPNPRPKLRSW